MEDIEHVYILLGEGIDGGGKRPNTLKVRKLQCKVRKDCSLTESTLLSRKQVEN